MGKIDRTKHDIDVIERVLGSGADELRSEVVELSPRPWLGGVSASSVQIQIGLPEDDERRDE